MSVFKTLTVKLRKTPLHPQWFAFFREDRFLAASCKRLSGVVVDIGCADGKPRQFLPPDARYIGIDYYSTAVGWYETRPDVYGDAQVLPLRDGSVDHVLLLDVLEHLPDPYTALREVRRVLKTGGTLTMQVPFIYPIHDAPLDFHRWTLHGLRQAAAECGYQIEAERGVGHPIETAALNANIAMSKTTMNWISGRNPLALTVVLLPFFVLLINCAAWLAGAMSRADDMMPYAYRMTWAKA